MKKSFLVTVLTAIMISSVAGLGLTANADVTPVEVFLSVSTGQSNYINNIRTQSVCVEGNKMIVSDFGVWSSGAGADQKNGALYFYEDGVLSYVFRYSNGNFNPKKASFGNSEGTTVYCLNNRQLLEIDLSQETPSVEVIAELVNDFQLIKSGSNVRLFALLDDTATVDSHIREYDFDEKAFNTTDLVTVIDPADSFFTDGNRCLYYGKKTSDAEYGMFLKNISENTENKIDYSPSAPTKIAMIGEDLITLSDNTVCYNGTTLGKSGDCFEICEDIVYVISNNRIEGYRLQNGGLISSGTVFSKAGNQGYPSEISAPLSTDGDWILDKDFASVVGSTQVFALPEGALDAFEIAVSGDFVFIAAPNTIFECDTNLISNGRLSPSAVRSWQISGVRTISASASGDLFVSANGKILKKGRDEATFSDYRNFDAERLEVSNRNNSLYALKDGKITAFGETDTEFDAFGATDFAIDFKNRIYALADESLLRISHENTVEAVFTLTRPDMLNEYGTSFNRIDFNEQTGEIFIIDTDLSMVFLLTKEQSGTSVASEIPVLSTDVIPNDKLPSADFELAKINGFPSTLLYPEDPSGEILVFGEDISTDKVFILDRTNDGVGSYAYVCARDGDDLYFGYVIDTNMTTVETDTPPFVSGYTAFSTEYYKYPDTAESFLIGTIPAGKSLTLNDSPLPGWLSVTFESDNEQVSAFVRRSAVYERITVNIDDRVVASTIGIGGSCPLYSKASISSDVITNIPDNQSVKIISRTGTFCYVQTSDNLFGYIESRFIVEEGFANSQKIGLVLLVSCAVLGALTILIRKKIIH